MSLVHEDVTFKSGGADVKAFLCRPEGETKRGAVIIVHEIFGLTDHILDVACRIAEAGYDGLAVDYFSREGAPPEAGGDFRPLREFVSRIPDSQLMADTMAAADYLKARPHSNGKVGIVGFCWGGRVAMLVAAEVPEVNAAVAYYGRIRPSGVPTPNQPKYPIDLADQMRSPLLGHFGANDQSIPPADAAALREALERAHKTSEIHVYEGAGHAFSNDTRPSYNAAAAHLAWTRTLAWLGKYLSE